MTFAQIVGHDKQKNILMRALETGRLAHAYLFHGPDGVGKRLVAQALARTLFCHEQRGCGDCPACRKVDHGNHPDLHILEPDGNALKIEQVRAIQRDLNLKPLEAPYKVCLIDNCEAMTTGAANALLKTLEEPRGDCLLILLTAQPERLLETIRSRCQPIQFFRHPRHRIQQVLEEQLGVDENEAHILAALSEGSFKKAFGKDRELYLEHRRKLLKTLTSLSPGSILPILDFADELANEKSALPDILEIFQAFYRDILLVLHSHDLDEMVNRDLPEKIHRVARQETVPQVLLKLEALANARKHLERNVNRQLAMEVLLLSLAA